MSLTYTQRQVLHNDAINQPTLAVALSAGDDQAIADFYNTIASPDFIVMRTSVTKGEYQSSVSPSGTSFSWTGTGGYIARSQGERDAWRELFEPSGIVNPSQANVLAAFNDIFSGTGAQAINNRTHLLSMSKRKATLAEKLLATGVGTDASPAILTFEGTISPAEASQIRVGD